MNIYLELHHYLMNTSRLVVIPNYYHKGFECDFFAVSKKLYTTEYEIKLSKSDYERDFQKKRNYYDWITRKKFIDVNKHQEIADGRRTNRFYFVVPKELDIVIPDYAGKIIFYEEYKNIKFKTVKRAKTLHKETIDYSIIEHIANNLSWRYYRSLCKNV